MRFRIRSSISVLHQKDRLSSGETRNTFLLFPQARISHGLQRSGRDFGKTCTAWTWSEIEELKSEEGVEGC